MNQIQVKNLTCFFCKNEYIESNIILYSSTFIMVSFSNLNRLSNHNNYLKTIFGQKKFFLVGGMIRDLLLDRETNMDDVDVTM